MILHKRHNSKKIKKVVRVKTYNTSEIFDFMQANPEAEYFVDSDGNRCKLRRANVFFKKGLMCVQDGCTNAGSFFALEQWPNDGGMHFDLYAIDETGDETLMTIDHTHPKSKGGRNHIANYEPMCMVCNTLKSNKIIVKEQVTEHDTFRIIRFWSEGTKELKAGWMYRVEDKTITKTA